MVTEQQVREDYRRWIGAMNAHDLALWDQFAEEMCTADYVHHPGAANRPRGPEGLKQMGRQIMQRYPNIHATLQDVFVSGDKAATRWVVHLADATPDKPAQDRLDLTLTRYEGRKVAEEWELLWELDPE
jgi:hypothetical protein